MRKISLMCHAFGTSTANFKFGPDGTMTESNVSVTDETAKYLARAASDHCGCECR